MSENTKVQPPPQVQDTRIITLLESNDVSFSPVDGQWVNNLNENTVLREGDSLTVRQSMIDTTSDSIGLIDVKPEDSIITIQHGIYSVDAGDGVADNSLVGPDGQTSTIEPYQHFSDATQNHPSGNLYVLQNQQLAPGNTKIYYRAGAGRGVIGTINPPNPDSVPSADFYLEMTPSITPGDLFEYTINTVAAAYVAPTGTIPSPPNGTTSPIIKPENVEGLRAILIHDHNDKGQAEVKFKIYANGFTPASGTINPDTDHIAVIQTLYEADNKPYGYSSEPNSKYSGTAAANEKWVFRTGSLQSGTGTPNQFWSNQDELGAESPIFRILKGFRMIVDDFSDYRDKKDRTNNPYQTQFTYTNQQGVREQRQIVFDDWGNANQQVYGLDPSNPGLFAQHEVSQQVIEDKNLYDLNTVKGRKAAGWNGFGGNYFQWVQFTQLKDARRPDHITLPEFVFNIHDGVEAFVFSGSRRVSSFSSSEAMGIYTPRIPGGSGDSYKFLSGNMMDTAALPVPADGGAILTPRIFTTKFSIPPKKYTYEALAQILTDRINSIPTKVTGQSNDPFPTDGGTPTDPNIRGFSNSRFLTTTADLSMQQQNEPVVSANLPFFPSRFQYTTESPPTSLLQPVWVSTDGTQCFQYDEGALNGFSNPRWEGAESVSFLYDQSSDAFQVAQAHSNIYSRLDGGIIARQFRVNYKPSPTLTNRDGDLITCDKAGGIFFTSLEPRSLWFDKMKFKEHSLIVSQLGNDPSVQAFNGGTMVPDLNPANVMLASTLTHSLNLTPGTNITGNFLGTALNIDKRVRTFNNPAPGDQPVVDFSGGKYAACDPGWILDVATDTPVTIPGDAITPDEITDPFFQIEISGMTRQNIVGATKKNNLIQSIVGKYFTNGGFTSGNIDDGFRYTHLGEPILLRSLSVRILDSDGDLAQGVGPNSAVILELDTVK